MESWNLYFTKNTRETNKILLCLHFKSGFLKIVYQSFGEVPISYESFSSKSYSYEWFIVLLSFSLNPSDSHTYWQPETLIKYFLVDIQIRVLSFLLLSFQKIQNNSLRQHRNDIFNFFIEVPKYGLIWRRKLPTIHWWKAVLDIF